MADESLGSDTGILEYAWADALGQPLERSGGRLCIVVRGGLHGSAYQSVCSAAFGDRLQLCTPIHRLRRSPDRSCSS